ncbi:MAG: YolD-like family protein [Firmicutes bacterium]|nr:YolD-like family protein [Bacillota bacterium]
MSDRGMKKWAPYKSLIEQDHFLGNMMHDKGKIAKPKLSNEQAEEIDRALREYQGGRLRMRYFQNGYVKEVCQSIKKIDLVDRIIIGSELSIALKDLLEVIVSE